MRTTLKSSSKSSSISLKLASIATLFFLSSLAQAMAPGELLELKKIKDMSKEEIRVVKEIGGIKTPTKNSFTYYLMRYATTDIRGKVVVASGTLAIPNAISTKHTPILSYQHGTVSGHENAPSRLNNLETIAASTMYASGGYIYVSADYLGLGDHTDGVHPYLHAQTEASASADALRAALSLNLSHSKLLFLAGYSQGGHATMALHQYWETHYGTQYPITAVSPLAGPYDLSGTFLHDAKQDTFAKSTSFYGTYLVLGLGPVYGNLTSLDTIFRPPFDTLVPELFNGSNTMDRIVDRLPVDPRALFTDEFFSGITTNIDHDFVKMLKQNDVYDYAPKAPLLLCHGTADEDVKPFNSTFAHKHLKSRGANVQLVLLQGKTHRNAAVPCMTEAWKFFDKKIEQRLNRDVETILQTSAR